MAHAVATRIAIAGANGRMGQMLIAAAKADISVEAVAFSRGVDVAAILKNVDVLVDFSHPDASMDFLSHCVASRVAIVIGTTGFDAAQKTLISAASSTIPVILAANTGVGINVMATLVAQAAAALGQDADIEIFEAHHKHKLDAPSGTALMLGEVAAQARGQVFDDVAAIGDRAGTRKVDSIGFSSIRAGDITGEHTVFFTLAGERIEITHRAQTRETFASGAIRAARFLHGKPAGFYSMKDVLNLP